MLRDAISRKKALRWVGVNFPGKKRYGTLEWPPTAQSGHKNVVPSLLCRHDAAHKRVSPSPSFVEQISPSPSFVERIEHPRQIGESRPGVVEHPQHVRELLLLLLLRGPGVPRVSGVPRTPPSALALRVRDRSRRPGLHGGARGVGRRRPLRPHGSLARRTVTIIVMIIKANLQNNHQTSNDIMVLNVGP